MDIINLRGIVIRSVDYKESSKILTIFTHKQGLISVMARGVKRPKSKKQNLCSIFTEANFELTKSKDFYYLKDGDILEKNDFITKNVKLIYLSQLFFDIIERTIPRNDKEENIYLLLIKSIEYLKKEENYLIIANMFMIKFISMLGYKPQLVNCVKCNKKNITNIFFSNEYGGILCKDCKKSHDTRLTDKEYKYLYHILNEVYENILIIDSDIDQKKIFRLIFDFIIYNTDINIPNSYKTFTKLEGII